MPFFLHMTRKDRYWRRLRMLNWAVLSAWKLHGPMTSVALLFSRIPLIGSLFASVTDSHLLVPVYIDGAHRMYVNVFDPGIAWQLLTRGMREDAHVAQIRSAVKSGMRGIELGANIGFFTIIESPLIGPEGHLWCIEPVLSNMKLLERNIKVNDLENRVSLFRNLVGEMNDTRQIHLAAASNSHTVSSQHSVGEVESVPMITLDQFMSDRDISPASVNFIRMDIEGYEVKALVGMRALMESGHPMLFFIEFHPQSYSEWGGTFTGFLQTLTSFGFVIRQAAKERERDINGNEITVVLDSPSVGELVSASERWRPGGIQAFLERV